MMATETATTYWVCEDCLMAQAGYDEHELGRAFECDPLNLIPADAVVTDGLLREEHDCDGEPECDCETVDFSRSSCDGCGSHLAGSRYALTVWTREED